jgi:16S rRNA G966 N2-methylase RsmD
MHSPLYSGDGPNPALSTFARAHAIARPFEVHGDKYEVGPFQHPIRTTKQTPIYALHGYHLGKKPHDAIRSYIRHYTHPGDLVLDPFSGSGSTALAASIDQRKAIGIDASPAATFIARYYLAPIDPRDLEARFHAWIDRVRDELAWLYATTCHRCQGPATLHYLIYSNCYACPLCHSRVTLFEASHASKPPRCPRCPNPRKRGSISQKLEIAGFVPVAVNLSCLGDCKPRRITRSLCGTAEEVRAFERIDLPAIEALQRIPIPHPVPDAPMMNVDRDARAWGDEWRPSRNFRTIRDLFTHRNLWALAALRSAASDDLDLHALVTSGMLAVSRKAQHLDGGGGYIPGNWALPPMSKQRNVLESLSKVFRRSMKAREQLARSGMGREVCLSTQSATDLSAIPDAAVDYVFTDPPYGGAVQYAELNFLWEAWLGLDTSWHDREIVVNRTRGKTVDSWATLMTEALSECHRVLKPGRWMSICYHDVSGASWGALQRAVRDAGFVNESSEEAVTIDTGGRTYNQYTVDKATKRDLVLNFRKPRSTKALRSSEAKDEPTFEARAKTLVVSFLRAHPGASRDRIYDDLVAKSVRAGTMQPHDFDRILRDVALTKSGTGRVVETGVRKGNRVARWYLR